MGLDPRALFCDIETGRGLVVAVSGGSDSLALLLLVHDFAAACAPPPRLLAVTVDHGLRPEAAAEAAQVAALCRARGIAHRTLRWRGQKPRTGVAAAAREARYDLLAEAAESVGAATVLTAHTLDDQAETLAMRAARGGDPRGGAGLAGMAAATLFDGRVWIVRPLLGLRRQALRDWLSARGVGWIDDPSNADPAFERVRVRQGLDDAGVEALARQARAAGAGRAALSAAAARLVERFAVRPAPGLCRLERGLFDPGAADPDAAVLALRAALATAGGAARLPDLARSRALLRRLAEGAPLRATLSRAVVDARAGGAFLRREARGLPLVALAGKATVWDGRLRVAPQERAAGPFAIGPLGAARAKEAAPEAADAPASLVRAALAVEPALFEAGELVGPAAGTAAAARGVTAVPVVAPFCRFLPGFDLALAAALGRLVCAPALPAPPWKHHIIAAQA